MSFSKRKLKSFIKEVNQFAPAPLNIPKQTDKDYIIRYFMQICSDETSDLTFRQRVFALFLFLFGSDKSVKQYMYKWANSTDMIWEPLSDLIFNVPQNNFLEHVEQINKSSILRYFLSFKINHQSHFIKNLNLQLLRLDDRQREYFACTIMNYVEKHPKKITSINVMDFIGSSQKATRQLLNPSLSKRIACRLFGYPDLRKIITHQQLINLILKQPNKEIIHSALRKPRWYEFNSKYFAAMLTASQWQELLHTDSLKPHKDIIEKALKTYINTLSQRKRNVFVLEVNNKNEQIRINNSFQNFHDKLGVDSAKHNNSLLIDPPAPPSNQTNTSLDTDIQPPTAGNGSLDESIGCPPETDIHAGKLLDSSLSPIRSSSSHFYDDDGDAPWLEPYEFS